MVGFAIAHGAALGLTLVTAEIIGGIMVIADYLREKMRERRLKQAERDFAKGSAQANAKWRAWYERRLASERLGQEFTEPPPDDGDLPK